MEPLMNTMRKKFLLAATASVALLAFVQSTSAQNKDHSAAGQPTIEEPPVNPKSSAAAHDRADAAMSGMSNPLPTEADRKAAAAMSK
jgi:hypothetical protein